jgi:hypothetical protein
MNIEQMMSEAELRSSGVSGLTEAQREVIAAWGLRMYGLGQYHLDDIEDIKYGGRLVILSDGSRWEVDEFDASVAEMWSPLDKVVVADDVMWKLDEMEKVTVTEEYT